MSGLTGADRRVIEQAREITELRAGQIPAYTGDDDTAMGYAVAFGRAQWRLGDLLRLVERLDGSLGEIRQLLADLDWERDDRQYALERIEMIVGGQS